MESLEEFDVVRALNFASSCRFLKLAEEELAGLVLRAESSPGARCLLPFPPLQPKYQQLLNATLARFDLKVTVEGWGDERRLVAEAARDRGVIPEVRYSDFRVSPGMKLGPRLRGCSQLSSVRVPEARLKKEEEAEEDRQREKFQGCEEHDDRGARGPASAPSPSPPAKRSRDAGGRRGMRGWSDDEDDDGEGEADSSPKKVDLPAAGQPEGAAGVPARRTWGRGFLSDEEVRAREEQRMAEEREACQEQEEDEETTVHCVLRGDFGPYTVDPEDTWRPHRKPYVELRDGWEFSGAWSFQPEDRPGKPARPGEPSGVATWRVEHGTAHGFAVVLAGASNDARRWLGGDRGRGEEPYVLEFKPCPEEIRWDFRFGRATQTASGKWKPLLWSQERQTTFWLASFDSEDDGRRYVCAGLDVFPDRRFFAARLASAPENLGFGVREPKGKGSSFYIRDISVFGRRSVLGSPFTGRDHFVEVGLPAADLGRRLEALALRESVLAVLPLGAPSGSSTALLVCSSPEQAATTAAALKGAGLEARAVSSSQWTWPPSQQVKGEPEQGEAPTPEDGPKSARCFSDAVEEVWRGLSAETLRELGLFKEHVERKTQHLEGHRIARTAAVRMIASGLRGGAARAPNRAGS